MARQASTGFEEVRHTADVAIRVWGTSLEELFQSAAAGMFATIGATGKEPAISTATGEVEHSINLEAGDLETLLVDWLNELLYLSETKKELYTGFEVQIEPTWRLQATVRGYVADFTGDKVKAVTYHGLSIEQTGGYYTAVVVFDT